MIYKAVFAVQETNIINPLSTAEGDADQCNFFTTNLQQDAHEIVLHDEQDAKL
jgi:hypothetical protein